MKFTKILKNGMIDENPVLVQVIGMCPTLGVTTSAINGLGMGLSTTVVLICSNIVISLMRKFIPDKIRIPAFIVVIATFVTMVGMLLKAYIPALDAALGLFIPLIVVNCLILARAESFASKNTPIKSAVDGLGMGLGFTLALTALGIVREILGNGTLFGMNLFGASYQPALLFILPPGAFLTLGFLLAGFNKLKNKKALGEEIMNLILLFLSIVFVNNVITSQFMGICPFLGVSKKVDTAIGMGAAVTFVLTLASFITYFVQKLLEITNNQFLQTIAFILVIASIVQFVEMVIQKLSPSLYQALGVFLPLITTNCAVLGIALVNVQNNYNLVETIVNGFGAGIGFTLSIVLFAGIRERLELADIPESFKGFPSTMIAASLMSIAFLGFSGLINL